MHMIHDSSSKKFKILGAGLACLDIIKVGQNIKYYNGGSCGNVIAALSFLGFPSDLISRKHGDTAGQILKANLKKFGVGHIEVGKRTTSTPRIIEQLSLTNGNYGGHDFLLKCPDCHQDLPKLKLLSQAEAKPVTQSLTNYNALYTDRVSPGIRMLRDNLNQMNAWTIYEPNSFRNTKAFFHNAQESSIVKFSSEKIPFEIANKLLTYEKASKTILIIQTLGKNGLRFAFRKKSMKFSSWVKLPAQPITRLVDTSGAGDWCTAGTIMNLLLTHPTRPNWLKKNVVISALQYGQALSAISCSFIGGQGLIYASNKNEIISPVFDRLNFNKLPHIKPITPGKYLSKHSCTTCLQ